MLRAKCRLALNRLWTNVVSGTDNKWGCSLFRPRSDAATQPIDCQVVQVRTHLITNMGGGGPLPRKTLGHFVLGAARAKFGGQVEWHLSTAKLECLLGAQAAVRALAEAQLIPSSP